jgi:hypothetical protein
VVLVHHQSVNRLAGPASGCSVRARRNVFF